MSQIKLSKEITVLLNKIDSQKKQIAEKSKGKEQIMSGIHEKLRYSWTYNSNAIEGSTLTEGETIFFLREGLTVEGKPLKDFLDARNHIDAIEFLFDVVKNNRRISESLIKEFNAFLLSGVTATEAINQNGEKIQKKATPGVYKKLPNHVLQSDGTIHYYVEPIQVPTEISKLISYVDSSSDDHPVVVASKTHYEFVRIHPFDDGNGRGARLLMNLILIRNGLPPAIIKNEKRRKYIEALMAGDNGDLTQFIQFVAESLRDTMQMIIEELEKV